jgi:hypothetical protein
LSGGLELAVLGVHTQVVILGPGQKGFERAHMLAERVEALAALLKKVGLKLLVERLVHAGKRQLVLGGLSKSQ